MARPASSIRSLPFRHNLKPALGFELFRLSALYERADRRALDHELETPQRPEFHTVYVGIRGRGKLVVDFTPVPLGARTLTVVAKGRVQQFMPDRSIDAWMLLFTPEFIGQPGGADPLVTPAILAPTRVAPAIAVSAADQRELATLAEQLEREHARPFDRQQPWLIAALLRALLLHAERLAGWQPPVSSLARFFTVLERDHTTTRSVAHYARQSGISVRRLAELLVAETGRSTKQVIDERVILEQKRLLAHTELSIKELSERTGFEEPTNLVKFFRHHTGETPLGFRRRVRPSIGCSDRRF
ncbi:MAG: helix-turn-helix domain-containing protein [Kofleriaceae bacterium]